MTAHEFRDHCDCRGFHLSLAEMVRPMKARMEAAGATWFRVTFLLENGLIVLDGWRRRPADVEDPAPIYTDIFPPQGRGDKWWAERRRDDFEDQA
jgi:hypothetical protein